MLKIFLQSILQEDFQKSRYTTSVLTPHSLIKDKQEVAYQPPFTSFEQFLTDLSEKYDSKPALVFDDLSGKEAQTISYRELEELTGQTASWLNSLNESGESEKDEVSQDRGSTDETVDHQKKESVDPLGRPAIAYCFENTPEVVVINYGAWRAGWVTVPLDSKRDTVKRKIYKLEQTQARLYLTRNDSVSQAENKQIQTALPHLQIQEIAGFDHFLKLLSKNSQPILTNNLSLNNDLNQTNSANKRTHSKNVSITNTIRDSQTPSIPNSASPSNNLEQPCLVLYTSGTTALPKGAVLTLTSLFANAESIATWLNFNEKDHWQIVLPLHHINSTTFVNTTILAGGTLILVPRYSKTKFWSILAQHRVTGTSVVPTIAYDLLNEQAAFDKHKANLTQLTRIQLGSAPVQPKVVKQFLKQFGIRFYQGYGQTETSLRSSGVPMDLVDEEYNQAVELNTLGTELKHTNLAVLDKNGSELGENQVGEICVRGPIIMDRYLNNVEATNEAFDHHWFHSGDTGSWRHLFGRRFYFLQGRTKEIIKKGGVLISPLAIENALLNEFPDLKMVYVVGIPDSRLGEEVGFIAVSDQPRIVEKIVGDLRQCRVKSLKTYEQPQAGILVSVDQLPTTSTGKVQRVKIKELFGPELRKRLLTVIETERARFRQIDADEIEVLKQAVQINNQRWGTHLDSNLAEFVARAENGLLLGMFSLKEEESLNGSQVSVGKRRNNSGLKIEDRLIGTVSGVRINSAELAKASQKGSWTSTWDGVAGNGTLSTHDHRGDVYVLVAVSVSSREPNAEKNAGEDKIKQQLTIQSDKLKGQVADQQGIDVSGIDVTDQEKLESYFNSDQDPILAFHYRTKAGLPTGAQFVMAIKDGRPADHEACGFNVLLQYPELLKPPTVDPKASPGTQLVEAALLATYNQKVTKVFAYSRPAALKKFLLSQ